MPSPHIIKVADEAWIDDIGESAKLQLDCSDQKQNKTDGERKDGTTGQLIYPLTLPPLRLRTPRGGELEIDSVFQKNLRVAKLCHLLGLPEVLTDWKFPKAYVSSRPDFSKAKLPPFRHTGNTCHSVAEEPANIVPSKYHVESLQKIEDLMDLRTDNVPSYVAAYLESSPRDPLAAEESCRKASGRVNEAARQKIYMPIVNPAAMHEKLTEPTDIRVPHQPFHNWCFGCRLELGIQLTDTHPSYDVYMCQNRHCHFACWQGLPVIFGPFRDRPVRVGGGFAYMDHNTEPYYLPASRHDQDDQAYSDETTYRQRKPVELPRMYRPGFMPFQPRRLRKLPLQPNKLPQIAEYEDPHQRNLYRASKESFDKTSTEVEDIPAMQKRMALATAFVEDNDRLFHREEEHAIREFENANLDGDLFFSLAREGLEGGSIVETEEGELLRFSAGEHSCTCPSPLHAHRNAHRPPSARNDIDELLITASVDESTSLMEDEDEEGDIVTDLLQLENDESELSGEGGEGLTERGGLETDRAGELGDSTKSSNDLATALQQTVIITTYTKSSTDASPEPSVCEVDVCEPSNPSPESSVHEVNDICESSNPLLEASFRDADDICVPTNSSQQPSVHEVDAICVPANLSPESSVCEVDVCEPTKSLALTADEESERRGVKKSSLQSGSSAERTSSAAEERASVEPEEPELVQITEKIENEDETEVIAPTSQVLNSPLLADKTEIRWVVKPLEVKDYEDIFVFPEELEPPVELKCDQHDTYVDQHWLEMDTNKVSVELVTSKEFVPILTITREILQDVLEEVMKRIAKKKAPTKKTKAEVVKKPARKVAEEVKLKTPTPPPREPTPPPKSPTPPPPPREPTPLPPCAPTPPREPTPPPPKTPTPPPLPKPPVELPPLPQTRNFVTTPTVPRVVKPKIPTTGYGTSLVSRGNAARDDTLSSTLSPSPLPVASPDFEFDIVPRSPTPSSVAVTPEVNTTKVTTARTLDSKIVKFTEEGNDWTFRQRLNIPVVAERPVATPEPVKEEETLPEVIETTKTATPPPEEPPVVRRRIRNIPKTFARVARTFRKKSARAVTKKELRQITDPLDYLAKYCLIHPDRLPVYERIFRDVVSKQAPRFSQVYCALDKSSGQEQPQIQLVNEPGVPHANLTDLQRKRLRDKAAISKVESDPPAMNVGEFHVAKLTFTIEQLYAKYEELLDQYEELERIKDKRLATLARKQCPHILDPDYSVAKKRKSSKTKKSKTKKKILTVEERLRREEFVLTDVQVMERLTEKEKQQISSDDEIYRFKLQLNRLETKIHNSEARMDELEAEKSEMQIWSQELYLQENVKSDQQPEFRRKQSALYNKFNPDLDEQMNIDEIEEALRTINGHLLTDREMQFIYHILKIPGRKVINLKTFGCIAALSEKVQQLHPVIRKLINKFDFEALDVKMEKCKELYELLYEGEEQADKPNGAVPIGSLCVELLAGGLSDEHLDFVRNKFNRAKKGYLEYMDFLTYIPLFVELHDRICTNPLTTERVS